MAVPPQPHPDFASFFDSWNLAMEADGYAANSIRSYGRAVTAFAAWLGMHHPGVAPGDAQRDHVRGWVVATREATSSGTARSHFAGLRHFTRWMVAEGEAETDATDGIRTPAPNDVSTPLLKPEQIRAMLATCAGNGFADRRDKAIIYVFIDAGLRLAECAGLGTDDVDIRDRTLFVVGKGANRSGPRRRAAPLGVKATQALDRYIRERRKHPYAERPELWLGDRGRATLSGDGIDMVLKRRASRAGIGHIHPHQLRHTWADGFLAAGGPEGDLMHLGGWRSRSMLDRYGRAGAADRARDAARRLSFGDRL